MESQQKLHRRNRSKEEDDVPEIPGQSATAGNGVLPPQSRVRVNSVPMKPNGEGTSSVAFGNPSPSAGPYRTSFNGAPKANEGSNGYPLSPLRSSFSTSGSLHGHSRTRSISTPFSPPLPSPLSSGFSFSQQPIPMTTSTSNPEASTTLSPTSAKHNRRHSRLHSRNLSVFFPRPENLPQNTISEDGAQELEIRVDEEAPIAIMPPAGSNTRTRRTQSTHNPPTPLGAGFTFGARPPSLGPTPPPMSAGPSSSSSAASRRGHHHKHSMSHNFFSFLEPGMGGSPRAEAQEHLHTQPTPMPVSPWTPQSATGFPMSPTSLASAVLSQHATSPISPIDLDVEIPLPLPAVALAVGQFILGAWLWVSGQQIGSLSTTGLGYWVVFDSFGVGLGNVLPWWLNLKSSQRHRSAGTSYGLARTETVLMFAQAVYLMFSSVYICKETVEHLLLSSGGVEGHHHHHGDEDGAEIGIEFPVLLTLLSFVMILVSAILFNNQSNLVNTAGNRIPMLSDLIRSWNSPSQHAHRHQETPTSPIAIALSNPYVLSPLVFCLALVFVASSVPSSQHSTCDLVLASIITVVTFNIAYRACTVLGTVLLQTSPRRGLSGGKMEAFLRVMREIERHPQVLHLPAPHIWQLSPTPAVSGNMKNAAVPLVITLELHVRKDLDDNDVLSLTKWAWERCIMALDGGSNLRSKEGSRAEVTVGVVRG